VRSRIGEKKMHDREWDASLDAWWSSLKLRQQETAMTRPASWPMPRWMVRTLKEAGVPGVVETPVDSEVVGPWFALPASVNEFLSFQRAHRMSRSARS
jgi:hypothetical protein